MTKEATLRAMASNYSTGHSWDHLDSEACVSAADEIRQLKAEVERLRPAAEKNMAGEHLRLAQLIHDYHISLIRQMMAQAQHWHETEKRAPLAVHYRVMASDTYFQVANLFDPAQRALGFDSPWERMEQHLATAGQWATGTYPPSPELHAYRDVEYAAAEYRKVKGR